MKRILSILFLLAFFFDTQKLNAQDFVPKALRPDNQVIQSKTDRVADAGWLYLKDEAQILAYDLFSTYKTDMGLGTDDAMVMVKDETDQFGWQHIRYQQFYKGVRVEGAEYTEHLKDCIVKIAHGKLLENVSLSTIAAITENQALGIALDHIGATTYSWEDTSPGVNEYEEEEEYDTLPPQGELLLGYINQSGVVPENYLLVWRFEVVSVDPGAANEIYIDAQTGQVLKMRSLECSNGPASLLYGYGTQTIDTKYHNGWFNDYYFLRAEDNSRNIHTRKGRFSQHGDKWKKYDEVKDDNDCWGCGTPAPSNIYTTAHWVVSQSWDYFKANHNHEGFDGSGGKVHVLSGSNLNNAVFRDVGSGWLEFGVFGGAQLAAIDVGGHEFTHGVTRHSANLGGANEPGALNESFSDIFGFLVERFSFPGNFDWLVGEDPIAGGLRSIANPGAIAAPALPDRPAMGLPNVVNGARWYTGTFDDGGEHINCGPQNRWFNLLSVGGTEAETGVNVQGIGIDNAAAITYLSLTSFIQNLSQYVDAREAAIAASMIIFGNCSFETIQTTNAWAAVGVGDMFDNSCVLDISGLVFLCRNSTGYGTWTVDVLPNETVTWSYPSWWNVTISGAGNSKLTLNNFITSGMPPLDHSVILTATSTSGLSDSHNIWVAQCLTPPCGDEGSFLISPPNNGFASVSKVDVGKVSIFPNPANDFLFIKTDGISTRLEIWVVDIYGRNVIESELDFKEGRLDISGLPPGMYFLKLSGQDVGAAMTFLKK